MSAATYIKVWTSFNKFGRIWTCFSVLFLTKCLLMAVLIRALHSSKVSLAVLNLGCSHLKTWGKRMASKLATWALFSTFSTDLTSCCRPWSFKLNRSPTKIIQSAFTMDKLVLKHKSMGPDSAERRSHRSLHSYKIALSIDVRAKPKVRRWRIVNFRCSSHSLII